jgi:hypothetical protein
MMYDLIVIGDDLASHVSAACASQNGLHTLLIAESGLGGLQLIDDFIFPIDATPLSGLGPDQTGLSILADLGILPPEGHAAAINPAYQIILPGHRIDFFNDADLLKAELAREFPEQEQDISAYYDMAMDASSVFRDWIAAHPQIQPQNLKEYFEYLKIYPDVFKYKYGVIKFDKILSQDASLEKAWEAQQALLSFNIDDLFSFASAFQYCAALRGVSCFPSGKQFLFNALIEKLESNKGLYLNNCQVTSLAGNKIIELDMKAPDGTTSKASGQNLIVSTKSDKLSMIQGGHQYLNFSDWIRPAKVAYYPFTIFLGISAACLPEQLARHVAVITDVTKDLYDNNLIILETSLPEEDQRLSSAMTSLSATVYLSESKENWTPDALHREANSILERLDVFVPFLRDNIALNNIDKSIDISLNSRGVLNPKHKVRNAFFTSFAAKSNKTRFQNIFLTGASLLTDAGYDAEIISGRNAALQVIKKGK